MNTHNNLVRRNALWIHSHITFRSYPFENSTQKLSMSLCSKGVYADRGHSTDISIDTFSEWQKSQITSPYIYRRVRHSCDHGGIQRAASARIYPTSSIYLQWTTTYMNQKIPIEWCCLLVLALCCKSPLPTQMELRSRVCEYFLNSMCQCLPIDVGITFLRCYWDPILRSISPTISGARGSLLNAHVCLFHVRHAKWWYTSRGADLTRSCAISSSISPKRLPACSLLNVVWNVCMLRTNISIYQSMLTE